MVVSKFITLSKEQQEVVSFTKGPILVKAGAGSGKTRILTERIRKLLEVTQRGILAMTFSSKASEELRKRLLVNPLAKDRLFICTFYGFCESVLRNNRSYLGFSEMPHIFELEKDRLKLVEEAILTTPSYFELYQKKSPKERKVKCRNALRFIAKIKRNLYFENKACLGNNEEDIKLFYTNYQEILQAQNAIDFDDLILLTYRLFLKNPAIAGLYRISFPYICIDEAQDLNTAQYQLIKVLTNGAHNNVMMVGDPSQSLFAYNDSLSSFMCDDFVKDFNPKIVELTKNYRSSKRVLEAANKIIKQNNLEPASSEEGQFSIHQLENPKEEAKWICKKIQYLIKMQDYLEIDEIITYENIVVLARNKFIFQNLLNAFSELDIPYNINAPMEPVKFQSTYVNIFDLKLKTKLNSADVLHENELNDLLKDESLKIELIAEIKTVVNSLKDNGENFIQSIKMLSKTFSESNLDDYEKSLVLNELEELGRHWLNYLKNSKFISLLQFKNKMALGHTRGQKKENGVTLSTVHTMKGQEFDIVFIMGMDDYTFPDYRAINKGGVYLTQEKNNAYVAFTRAKRFLYVTWPAQRTMPWGDVKNRSRSRFLKEFP